MNPELELLYDDDTPVELVDEHAEGFGRGLVERDLDEAPLGGYGATVDEPDTIVVYDHSEWPERIADMEANQSRISDIRAVGNYGNRIPSLNQGQLPYCWAHNPTMAVILLRAINNLPYHSLSACSVACLALNWRVGGAWAALALDTIQNVGIADEKYWPQRSTSRSNDNAQTRKNMAMHKVLESWYDLNAAVYSRKLTFDQKMSLLMQRVPVCNDYYWWGHSVVSMDPVNMNAQKDTFRAESGKLITPADFDRRFDVGGDANGYGSRDLNSWGDSWGQNGEVVIAGSKAVPSGAVAPRTVVLAA